MILAELDGLNTPDRNGNRPLVNNDPAQPDEAYFNWVDRIINKARRKVYMGLFADGVIKLINNGESVPVIFNERNIAGYGRFWQTAIKIIPISFG